MKQQTKYEQIVRAFYAAPWAILPEKLEVIGAFLEMKASGGFIAEEEVARIAASSKRPTPQTPGTVAVIPIWGVISPRLTLMSEISGGTSIDQLTAAYRAAFADPNVKAIVFDIDSPGGSVQGVHEFAQEILANRGQKKTVAVSSGLMASAAYYIGCAADEIVASPSSLTGSIGVLSVHEDVSKLEDNLGVKTTLIYAGKYKVEANSYEPLSGSAKEMIQEMVDAYYTMFVDTVAAARGSDAATVRAGYGQGRCLTSRAAVSAGLVDKVATLDQTLARFSVTDPRKSSASGRRASASASADAQECTCPCEQCLAGDCADCSDEGCVCEGCTCDMAAKAATRKSLKSAARERELTLLSM